MRDERIAVRSVLAGREMEEGPEEKMRALAHWVLARDADGIAWLTLDRAGESANTLSEEVIRELDQMLTEVEGLGARGLVIRSAKPAASPPAPTSATSAA